MQVDVNRLKGCVVSKGMSQEEFAQALEIDYSTLTRKIKKQGLTFTVGQMHKIVDILGMSADEAKSIFLFENSH